MQLLRKILVLLFTTLTLFLLITFRASMPVWLSFFFNAIILFIIFIYHIFYEKIFSPFITSFLVFNYLFLFFAPIVQIGSFYGLEKAHFPQNFPYQESLVIYANFLIALFNSSFFIFYLFLKRTPKTVKIKYPALKNYIQPLLILSLFIISIIILVTTFNVVIDEIIKPYWQKPVLSKIYILIIKKTLLFIPFGALIISYYYLKQSSKKTLNYFIISIIFLFLLLILFWFKNPLTEKRNALGPLYITLLFMFRPKWLNNNSKMMMFLFFSMVIAFPLMAVITHTKYTLNQLINKPILLFDTSLKDDILKVFHTLHYDAFSNIVATIDYVSKHGLVWGKQLLGVFTFYIPRNIWESKPIGTGELIGKYLISDYKFVFGNLSNPLVSEGYINFGILGVILMAFLLAYFIKKMHSWLYSNYYVKKILAFYFSIHLIFLLRGDLLNGVAYFIGVLLGVLFIPFLVERFLLLILHKKYK